MAPRQSSSSVNEATVQKTWKTNQPNKHPQQNNKNKQTKKKTVLGPMLRSEWLQGLISMSYKSIVLRPREVSKPRDLCLELSDRYEI